MAKLIFDGENAILGRLGAVVCKELLKGHSAVIINSEKVLVSGSKSVVVEKIRAKQKMGRGSSLKGPKYSIVSDRLLKRMLRGMLPWDRTKGREAYKRLRCFIGAGGLSESEIKNAKNLNHKKPSRYSTVKEIVEALK